MKKILIGLSLSLVLSLLLVGCGVSLPKGEWIVEDKVYQYSNFFISDATMMKDFLFMISMEISMKLLHLALTQTR